MSKKTQDVIKKYKDACNLLASQLFDVCRDCARSLYYTLKKWFERKEQ